MLIMFVLVLIIATYFGTRTLLVVPENRERIDRNAEILQIICDAARNQNDVLLRYGIILTTPIPIPPDADPALAKAIADRNRQFAEAGEFARANARDFTCPVPSK